MHRYSIAVVLVIATVLVLVFASGAFAFTIQGGDSAHRGAAASVVSSVPGLLNCVQATYPAFSVHIDYGGMAFPGYIDVCCTLMGKDFTNEVAHEFCHEVQLACDNSGRGSLTAAWHRFMAQVWPQVNTSQWTGFTWNHTLMEALRQAFYAPYYANPPEYRVYATKAQMTAILASVGVTP